MDRLYPHLNQCPYCQYLGDHEKNDLYFCEQPKAPHPIPVIVAVNPEKYTDGKRYRIHAEQCKDSLFGEALRRANNLGWYLQDQPHQTD